MDHDTRYLLIRTRLPLETDARLIRPMVRFLPHRLKLFRPGGTHPWGDGLAIMFQAEQTPEEISEILRPSLSELAMWTIHDGLEVAHEPYGGGLVKKCFRETSNLGMPITQVFIKYQDYEDNDSEVSERIKGVLGQDARRVFHFRNGCVFMLRTSHPPAITARRFERIHKRIGFAVVTDGNEARGCPENFASDCWRDLMVG